MKNVIVESPYKGDGWSQTQRNIRYAQACLRDCLLRGEAPMASHLLYTQPGVLDDKKQEERELGINAGFEWRLLADKTALYIDLGVSQGMIAGMEHAVALIKTHDHQIEFRKLPPDVLKAVLEES